MMTVPHAGSEWPTDRPRARAAPEEEEEAMELLQGADGEHEQRRATIVQPFKWMFSAS